MAKYQPHDRFYHRARQLGLPSRAAFKLEELIARFGLLKPGARVVDLGCAPGGWLAVLARIAGPGAKLVGVDLVPCQAPAPRVVTLTGDIRDAAVRAKVLETLGGAADLVTSDLAPKLSGIAERDEAVQAELLGSALEFVRVALRPGGAMVAKLFMGSSFAEVLAMFRSCFSRVEVTRTKATRPGSSELYLVARDFKGDS